MCYQIKRTTLCASPRLHPDGKLTSGLESYDIVYENTVILTNEDYIDTIEDNVFTLTKGEQLNTMNTGEDEPSSGLNGRLRPRKSNATLSSPAGRSSRKTDKLIQDKQKRNVTPSKTQQNKTDDLVTPKPPPDPHLLCPYCERKFATKLSASKHARRIHLSTSKQDHFINCLYCNHSEAESHDIIRHMVDSHPNQYFACLDCHTRFPSTTELAEHKLNVCEKQKAPYRSKLRQKNSVDLKKNKKRLTVDDKGNYSNENKEYTDDNAFSGMVISCELKPSQGHDAADIEDNITTNLILPPGKTLGNTSLDKNTVMVLDDLQWNKRIATPNFTFHNTDADQILSRLGVVHRSPRVGESTRRAWLKMLDENNQKFEKCFDTNFYSKVASNVQENLSRFLDGSFNFNPDADSSIKTRKSKSSVIINTAEGFPILLAYEQFTRHVLDGYMPRPVAPRHKWKWGNSENEENASVDPNAIKRDSHVNNCIITLVSSLDIWTQLRMRRKFEDVFSTTSSEKTEKNNIIALELKEILESRELPTSSCQVVKYSGATPAAPRVSSEWASYLGLSPVEPKCVEQPAVLSGEWVRPRCYICCACGEQTRDARGLTSHMSTQHPYAQVQHYEIVGDTLLNSDIIKHLYVPPSQLSNRTRPPRGFRDCTKCKKSIALEDMHQHMLDCAGDTPTVRRKVRYRPFGVRRRRSRLPDNTIRKKIRKEIRSRHRQKVHMRPRPKIRTEVGDAESIRKMIADLPAKRARVVISNPSINIRQNKDKIIEKRSSFKINRHNTEGPKNRITRSKNSNVEVKDSDSQKKQSDNTQSDDDDEPLKLNTKSSSDKKSQSKETISTRTLSTQRSKRSSQNHKTNPDTNKNRFLNKSNISSSSTKRVNVKTSSARLRERGTRSERNDKRRSKSGDRASAGRDSETHNVAPGANAPLKHSIARLTADNDPRVKTLQQLGPDTTEQKQVVSQCVSTDKQQLFENDTKSDKLDKPPLTQNVAKISDNAGVQKSKSSKPRKRLTDCIAMLAKKVGEPGQELKEAPAGLLKVTSESDQTQSKSKAESNEVLEMDKIDETLAKYDGLRGHAKAAHIPSHGTILELTKRSEKKPDGEREKERRVSTSFFEKNTLQIPLAPENSDAPNDPDPPIIVSRHMSVSRMTDNSNLSITPAKSGPRMLTAAELIDTRYQRKSAEEPMPQATSQRRSSFYGSNFVQPLAKQIDAGRRKSSLQSATHAESESRAQIYNPTIFPNFPYYPRPEFYAEPSSSNARRKSYDCVPTSAALNQYYHSQLSQRQNFLSVPLFVRPELRNLPLEGIDKNLALQLLNYGRNPTDMTAFTEGAPPELAHFVNWEGHPRHLYTSPSPDSRHLRHDSIQRETIPSLDINLETPHNYNSVHRTTPVKTPDGRICLTPVQHDSHHSSLDISNVQQVNNNYMRSITTPELNSMNPPSSIGVRRESCKRVLDTTEKGFHSQEFSDESSQNKMKRSPDNILSAHAIYPGGSEYNVAAYHHPRDKVNVSVSPLSQDSFEYKKATSETFYSHVSGKSNDSFNTSVSAETSISETPKRGHNEGTYPERTAMSRDFEHDVRQATVYGERLKLSKEQYSDTTLATHRDRFRSPVANNVSRPQQEILNVRITKETLLYPDSNAEQLQKSQPLLNVTPHYNIPAAHRTSVTDAPKHSFSVDHNDPRLLDNYKDELPLNMVRNSLEFERTHSIESGQMPLDLSTKAPEDNKDKKVKDDGPEDMSIKTHEQKKVELRVKSMKHLSNSEYGPETAINLIQNKATPELEVETILSKHQYGDTFNKSNHDQVMIIQQSNQNVDKPEHREHVASFYDYNKPKYSQYVETEHINKTTTNHNASSLTISKSIPNITVNYWEREELRPEVTVDSDVEKLGSQLTARVITGMDPDNCTFHELHPSSTSCFNETRIALQTDDDKSGESSEPKRDVVPTNIHNLHFDANTTSNVDKEDKRKNLPKEIIDLIGDLPKGNLDRLLDILPQYVCIPNTENKSNNESASKENPSTTTSVVTPAVTENTTDKTLTINTNLLSAPSCILPKKRHSPKPSYAQQYHQKYLDEKAPVTSPANPVLPPDSLMMQDVKPNIDQFTTAMTTSFETGISAENSEFKVVDLTEDDKITPGSNEIISMGNSSALPLGQDISKPPKSKNSNDKTAILRAVRFKKSSGDTPQQLTLPEGSIQNQDLLKLDDPSFVQKSLPASDDTEEKAEILPNSLEKKPVSKEILEHYEVIPQENNVEQNHFLGSSLKEGSTESNVLSSEICVSSVASSTVPDKKDSVVEPSDYSETFSTKSGGVNLQEEHPKTKPLTVICDLVRSTSQDTEHVSPDSVLEPKMRPISNDEMKKYLESAHPSIEIHKPDSSKEIISDDKNIEDYDSDDDVSLAFIARQNQLDQTELLCLETKTKQKLSVKQSKKPKKTKKKRKKSMVSKNFPKFAFETSVSDINGEQNSKNVSNVFTEMNQCEQVIEDDFNSSTQQNAVIPIKTTETLYKCDKDNNLSDQINKTNDCDKVDTDQRTLNEKNTVEEKVDMGIDINKTLEEIKAIKDSVEDGMEDSTSKNKRQKGKKGKRSIHNNETDNTKTLKKDNGKMDTPTAELLEDSVTLNTQNEKVTSGIHEQDSPVHFDIDLETGKKAKKCRTKQKNKLSLIEDNDDEILSSTETATPTIPLRRSRRGKSFYAEVNDSVTEIESTVQSGEKVPLTKKQLIFSKLLQDENESIESISEQEISNDNVLVTSSEKKKSKPIKRKKSPQGRKHIKRNKSFERQHDKDLSDNNVTSPSADTKPNLNDNSLKHDTTKEVGVANSKLHIKKHDNTIIEENNKAQQPTTSEKRKSDSVDISTVPKKTKLTENETTDEENNANGYESENLETNDDGHIDDEDIEGQVRNSDLDLNESRKYKQDENILKTQHKDNTNSVYRKRKDSGSVSETKTACYNRQTEYQQQQSKNYDPYDINMDEMIQINIPIIENSKDKQSKSSPKNSKRGKRKSSLQKDKNSSASDSDSSRSDVPLQKYFEEKRMFEHKQSKDNKENMIVVRKHSLEHQTVTVDSKAHKRDHIEEKNKTTDTYHETNISIKDDEPDSTVSTDVNDTTSSVSPSPAPDIDYKATHSKSVTEKNDLVEEEVNLKDNLEPEDIHNSTVLIPSSTEKPIKEKKPRKSLNIQNVDTDTTANGPPSKDLYLENFGFFSERKPRKSNLLATKKISETINLFNDSDDNYFNTKDRANKRLTHHRESKKTTESETTLKALQDTEKVNNELAKSKVEQEEMKETETNHQSDAEMDAINQNILNSEEVRKLEKDLIDGFRKAAEENANQSNHTDSICVENNSQNDVTRDLTSPEDNDLDLNSTETKKGKNKLPKISPPGYKKMMYPEIKIDEIDLFEDKFDKIKRKCRSQAAAAKQTSVVDSTSPSDKFQKKPEKKMKRKCAKKNTQSTNVPTKAALKGFDGIKISILTQDLNMPPSITPPKQQKKRKGGNSKKKRDRKDSDCSSKYDSDPNTSLRAKERERDIYEFKDNDDTELLELRPSTVMDRFRSLNKEQSKQKDKCKDNQRHSKSSRHADFSDDHDLEDKINDSIDNEDTLLEVDHEYKGKTERRKTTNSKFDALLLEEQTTIYNDKQVPGSGKQDPDASNIQGQARRRKSTKRNYKNEDHTKKMNENENNVTGDDKKGATANIDDFDDDSSEGTGNIPLASTSRFVPPTNDDSSFEWHTSSPESGYAECTCSMESDSETGKKGCDSLACIHLKNNAEKKAVMGKIFKNNAVRENNESLESPKDMDQLFDSLLESNSNDVSLEQNDSGKNNRVISPVAGPSTVNYVHYDDNTSPRVSPRNRKTSQVFSRMSPQTRDPYDEDNTSQEEVELDAFSRLLNTPSTSAAANIYAPCVPLVKINDDSISNNDDLYRQCILTHNEDDTNDSFTDQSNNVSPVDEYVMMSSKNTQTEDPETIVEAPKSKPRGDDDESDLDDIESNDFIALRRYAITDSNVSQTEIPHSDPAYPSDDLDKFFVKKENDNDTIDNTPQPGDYTMMSTKYTQTNTKKRKSKLKHGDDERSDDDPYASNDRLPKDKITLKKFVAMTVKSTQTEYHKTKLRKSSKYEESNSTKFVELTTSKDKRKKTKISKKSLKIEIEIYNEIKYESETVTREDDKHEIALKLEDSFIKTRSPSTKSEDGTSHNYESNALNHFEEYTGVARQRARRKCTVGKQNVLAEHWSSESEAEAIPARPSSADSVVGVRRKKGRKREGQHASASGKRARHARKEIEASGRAPPPGPTIRARPALMPPYWNSDTEDTIIDDQALHGWIVGSSHKKLVTLLANAKGRNRTNDEQNLDE